MLEIAGLLMNICRKHVLTKVSSLLVLITLRVSDLYSPYVVVGDSKLISEEQCLAVADVGLA